MSTNLVYSSFGSVPRFIMFYAHSSNFFDIFDTIELDQNIVKYTK